MMVKMTQAFAQILVHCQQQPRDERAAQAGVNVPGGLLVC